MRLHALAPGIFPALVLALAALVLGFAPAVEAAEVEVYGRALGSGDEGLAGAEVEVRRVLPLGPAALLEHQRIAYPQEAADPVEASAVTEPGGHYRVAVSPGIWELRISAPDRLSRCFTLVPLITHSRIPTVRLPAAQPRHVRVLEPGGTPLDGAWVRLSPEAREPKEWGPCAWTGTTDDRGVVALAVPATRPGTVSTVDVFRPGFEPVRQEIEADAEITLQPARAEGIALEIVDPSATEDTEPVPVVALVGEGRWSVARSDDQGRLVVSHVPVFSEELLLVTADGRTVEVTVEVAVEDVAGGDPDRPIRVTLPRTRSFEGRVRQATLEGPVVIPDALVWDLENPGHWTPVAPDGGYRLVNVQGDPGGPASSGSAHSGPARSDLVLAAQAPGYERLDQEFSLPRTPREDGSGSLAYTDLDFWLSATDSRVPVRGQVVDPQNQPIPGAEVIFVSGPPHAWHDERVRWALAGVDTLGPQVYRGTSDAEGVFTVHAGAGEYHAIVLHPELAPKLVPGLRVPEPTESTGPLDTEPFDIGVFTLEAGHVVEGFVEDSEGEGLAGVTVHLAHPYRRGGDTLWIDDQRRSSVVTGSGGAFRLDRLPALDVALRVEKTGYTEATVPLRLPVGDAIRIVLQPTTRITGRVVDESDRPTAGAEVRLVREGEARGTTEPTGPTGGPAGTDVQGVTHTDREGRFGLSEVPPGTWRLNVRADGYAPATVPSLQAEGGEPVTDIEVVLQRGVRLSGRVLTLEGAPAFDARVAVAGQLTVTEKDGSFELPTPLAPGTVRVEARHADYGVARETVSLPDTTSHTTPGAVDGGPREQVELVLEPRQVLAGRVVDSEGRGVDGSLVSLRSLESPGSSFESTENGGRFAFRNVEPGRYSMVARKVSAEARQELALGNESLDGLELVLQPPGRIEGRVLGLTSAQLGAVSVICRAPERPDGCRLSVSQDGDFASGPMPPGTWTVVASLAGADRWVAETVGVAPGETRGDVELEFRSGSSLSGRILHNSAPLINAEVRLHSRGVPMAVTRTDWQGEFHFEEATAATAIEVSPGHPGFRAVADVPGACEGARLDLDLRTGAVTGRVSGPGGSPLAFTELLLSPAKPRPGRATLRTAGPLRLVTDAEGGFYLPDVPVGLYRLELREGGQGAFVEVEVQMETTATAYLTGVMP